MAHTIITLDLLLSLILAYIGRHKTMGFWGLFFASVLLTPIIGLILLLVTRREEAPRSV
jgi:hypothetical protein|tara:strand:- start:1561 stop:1737 length:177 start_codon:yes stop_codon:yes gene_type:complete